MKKRKFYLILFLLFMAFTGFTQSPFTPGNIVVFRVGNGSTPFTNAEITVPAFLDEFTPAGVLVQSIAMPTSVSGANKAFTVVAGWNQMGKLELSTDGRYLVSAGYNATVGTPGPSNTPGSSIARVIGLVDYNGVINTSTALTDNSSIVLSAVSTNGTDLWVGGYFGNAEGGIRYATVGATTSTQVASDQFVSSIKIAGGQLYASQVGSISTVGTGLPTTSGQTLSAVPGLSTGGDVHQFVFLDLNAGIPGNDVCYAADEFSGIKKYSFNGATWVLNGTVGADANDYRGLTGRVSGTTVTLFATRIGGNNAGYGGGELVTLTDASGYNGAFSGTPTVLSNTTTRYGSGDVASYRGVAFVPSSPASTISAKIFLQGAYNSGLGRHKDVTSTWAAILNANALNQPFNTAAFGNYNGGESVSNGFFTSTVATTNILDWVLVELRDGSNPATLVARKAAFVREDGQIVGLNGTSAVDFTGVTNGNYYLVVRHRNHLSVRSSTTIAVSGGSTASYDFTTAQSKAFQDGAITANPAMKDLGGGVFGLWGGNANSNTNVRFTGVANDATAILAALGANQAAVLSNQYNAADVNLDGTIRYTGVNNDATTLLSVLGSNQAAVFTQHQ